MERLGHGAEAGADAGRHGGRDAERPRDASGVEPQQLSSGHRRSEGADGAGGVEAAHVVVGIDRLGDLAGDLEAGVDGGEKSEERRVGQECVSPITSSWLTYKYKKKNNQ